MYSHFVHLDGLIFQVVSEKGLILLLFDFMFTLVLDIFHGRFNINAVEKNTRTVRIFYAQGHKLPGLILVKYFFIHNILSHSKYILILEICSVDCTLGCRKKNLYIWLACFVKVQSSWQYFVSGVRFYKLNDGSKPIEKSFVPYRSFISLFNDKTYS